MIDHDNICEVIDLGVSEEGDLYDVMPLLKGEPLSVAMKVEAPFGVTRACDVTLQMLNGLDAAHRVGIVHRDLKPQDVFLRSGPNGPLTLALQAEPSTAAAPEPSAPGPVTGPEIVPPSASHPEPGEGILSRREVDLPIDPAPMSPGEADVDEAGDERRGFWRGPWPWIIGGILVAGAGTGVGLYFGLQPEDPNVTLRTR